MHFGAKSGAIFAPYFGASVVVDISMARKTIKYHQFFFTFYYIEILIPVV
jgi:hypothetical protein